MFELRASSNTRQSSDPGQEGDVFSMGTLMWLVATSRLPWTLKPGQVSCDWSTGWNSRL